VLKAAENEMYDVTCTCVSAPRRGPKMAQRHAFWISALYDRVIVNCRYFCFFHL